MDTRQPLDGQTAVVTGAGRGIGAAIARKLAALGAMVALCGRTRTALEATAKAIAEAAGKSEVVSCDVSDLHSVEMAAQAVEKKIGRIQILVNNAGVGGFGGPLRDTSSTSRRWQERTLCRTARLMPLQSGD